MSRAESPYFVTNGTLAIGVPSYIKRGSDEQLFQKLSDGEFCYVLTSRQMGKSSMMVRAAERLRHSGAYVALIDLQFIGRNVDVDDWYLSLLLAIGEQLGIRREIEECWIDRTLGSALQRWIRCIREVVLEHCRGHLVVFVDEIDFTRSLPFKADEFFAGIRSCYNHRSTDDAFRRLTFCLLGVATPSDLIADARSTPFNIGWRIVLRDFHWTEVKTLANGLCRDERTALKLLKRVYYWTGGHPCQTQILCQGVASDLSIASPAGVDGLCRRVFLTAGAVQQDNNLVFVRDQMLNGDIERTEILDSYLRARGRRGIRYDESSPILAALTLTGVVRAVRGRLFVRNRVYYRVFNSRWVTRHLPQAELRRQRAAELKGMLRAGGLAAVILALGGLLAGTAVDQARRAEKQQRETSRVLYYADTRLAYDAWQEDDWPLALDLLEEARRLGSVKGEDDPRDFEWGHLWRSCHTERLSLRGHTGPVSAIACAPNSSVIATGSTDRTVRIWDSKDGKSLRVIEKVPGTVTALAFTADGKRLAGTMSSGMAVLWDVETTREIASRRLESELPIRLGKVRGAPLVIGVLNRNVSLTDIQSGAVQIIPGRSPHQVSEVMAAPGGGQVALGSPVGSLVMRNVNPGNEVWAPPGDRSSILVVAYSPDGRSIATGSWGGIVRVRDAIDGRLQATFKGHTGRNTPIVFSPDSATLATGSGDGSLRVWNISKEHNSTIVGANPSPLTALEYLPAGRMLVTGDEAGMVRLWDVKHRQARHTLLGHTARVNSVAFSPDGRTLATVGHDRSLCLWDARTGSLLKSIRASSSRVWCVAFSPDGDRIALGDAAGVISLWRVDNLARLYSIRVPTTPKNSAWINSVGFSADGRRVASGGADSYVRIWDCKTRQEVRRYRAAGRVHAVAYSPDGRTLAAACDNVVLWDLKSDQRTNLEGHLSSVFALAYSPNSKVLASGSWDGGVRVWDIDNGTDLVRLKAQHNQAVFAVSFAPTGKRLASAGEDGKIKIWDVLTGREMLTLPDADTVTSLAFSPDGRGLASGCSNSIIRIWLATNPREADAADHQIAIGDSGIHMTEKAVSALPARTDKSR